MLSVRGIYENGQVQLLEPVFYPKRAKVIVTILEETEKTSNKKTPKSFIGSLTGIGETIGDLTEPLEPDEWETD